MSNIKNNNYRKIDCRIINDNYIDLMISKDNIKNDYLPNNCIATKINFGNIQGKHVISEIAWDKSVPSNKILDNIGYTGVDNGFISYERDRIGNDEFLELYKNSKFDLSTFGNKFFVTEVNGNNSLFTYPNEKHEDFISLKGGFYQGFFKIDGDKYQTLPHRIKSEWNFNIELRPKDYETPQNILNNRHKSNKGFFLYIGSRAENKFWELYKKNDNMKEYLKEIDDYSLDYSMTDSKVVEHNYIDENALPIYRYDVTEIDSNENSETYNEPIKTYNVEIDDYFLEWINPYEEEYISNYQLYSDYFIDDYRNDEHDSDTIETDVKLFNLTDNNGIDIECIDGIIEDDYILPQLDISTIKLTDSNNRYINEKGFYEIKTDNKFIIFNRTNTGYTKTSWNDMYEFFITGRTDSPNINYFPYLNRTSTGYTKDNIHELIENYSYTYDVFKDLENNALAFKLNDDGSLSYRYLSTGCKVIEETSKPNIVNKNEWNNINIRIKRIPYNECDDYNTSTVMKIYIYVNGYLKMVSKELPELMLKPLNDAPEKQEGVPYSLSIGGGSQGLCERILLNYYDMPDYLLPIEENFCGTFIGDIRNFTFIFC